MKKLSSKTLQSGATQVSVERGEMDLDKGRVAKRLRVRLTIPITKTSNGALSDTQKQALLALILFSMEIGSQGTFQKPWISQPLTKVERMNRILGRCDFGRYTDTVDGLAYVLVADTQANLICDVLVPLSIESLLGEEKDIFGMGPTQLAMTKLTFRKTSDTVASGITISGNVTVDVFADDAPAKSDRFSVLPEYVEQSQTDVKIETEDGLPLHVGETSAIQASSLLTNVKVSVDKEVIHDSVGVNDFYPEVLSESTTPAIAITADRETLIFTPTLKGNRKLRQFQTGPVKLEQLGTRQLTTLNLASFIIPIKSKESIDTEIRAAANKSYRNKTLKAVSIAATEGLDVPDRLRFALPFVMFDTDDAEFELYPGTVSESGGPTSDRIPEPIIAAARAKIAAYGPNKLAAAKVVRSVAVAVPGIVENSRGFAKGSSAALQNIEALIRG